MQFYKDALDRINFSEIWKENVTILDKLKTALMSNLKNDQASTILKLLDDFFSTKKNGKSTVDFSPKLETSNGDQKQIAAN